MSVVRVYYSVDPDPRARFWRSAAAKQERNIWVAKLPIMSLDRPLFAFANVHYRLDEPVPVPFASAGRDVCAEFAAAHRFAPTT